MARAAVPGRLISGPRPWLVATIKAATDETATARTLTLDVPGWPGHLPGQHADVRLTAEDGYSAQRSYSIASAPEPDRDLAFGRAVRADHGHQRDDAGAARQQQQGLAGLGRPGEPAADRTAQVELVARLGDPGQVR